MCGPGGEWGTIVYITGYPGKYHQTMLGKKVEAGEWFHPLLVYNLGLVDTAMLDDMG